MARTPSLPPDWIALWAIAAALFGVGLLGDPVMGPYRPPGLVRLLLTLTLLVHLRLGVAWLWEKSRRVWLGYLILWATSPAWFGYGVAMAMFEIEERYAWARQLARALM
jgi:hypothetical protein